jgi:hypothetical protein
MGCGHLRGKKSPKPRNPCVVYLLTFGEAKYVETEVRTEACGSLRTWQIDFS